MKTTDVNPFLMSYALPRPLQLPFWGGERTILKRDAMLFRVTADTGLVGYAPGPAHERAAREIHETVRAFLLGKDPRLWAAFDFVEGPNAHQAYRAVEIAIMDLAAKYEGCPLSELLGGRQRDRIKLYGSAGMYLSPVRQAEEAVAVAGLGLRAYKMRAALGPDRDLETVRLMREAVGPDVGRPPPRADRTKTRSCHGGRSARSASSRTPAGSRWRGFFWLEPGWNSFGSDAANAIVLPSPAPGRAGMFELIKGKITVHFEPGVPALVNGRPVDRPQRMRADADGEPDLVQIGDLTMFVIKRGDRYGIRMRDRNSRMGREFKGLSWYPVQPAYRVEARWEPYDPPRALSIPNILGMEPSTGQM